VRSYLSICAVYRDEAPYLREWVEFHRLVGVERFFLYNNDSVDDHREALAPYLDDGSVTIHDWPQWPAHVQTYDDCLKRHREDSRWIAFIDLDEFLFSPQKTPLPVLLREYEEFPGVGVNWAAFGSSGHETRPSGLVLESYVRRTEAIGVNRHIKSIVNPMRVRAFASTHFFMFDRGLTVDERRRPITGPPLSMTEGVSFERLRVNHYVIKSEEEFRLKVARGPADAALMSMRMRNRFSEARLARMARKYNNIEDRTIQMYLGELKEALARHEPPGPVPVSDPMRSLGG
jgi:hypothetical protein